MQFTLQQAAQQALDLQNACNLSGVAHSLIEVLEPIREEMRKTNQGTEFVNSHPIITLFLAKLASLNRTDCFCIHCMSVYSHTTKRVDAIARNIRESSRF